MEIMSLFNIKKIFFICLLYTIVCCKGENEDNSATHKSIVDKKIENNESEMPKDYCTSDSIEIPITEYQGIKFYTDNTLRGAGVVQLLLNNNTNILNENKTVFGSILLNSNEADIYEIKLVKNVIAREIIPNSEYRIFSFDAEQPETDKNFLIIYINGEKKLIEKKINKYNFSTWEEYIKKGFIHLTSKIDNSTKEEQMYYYKVLEIKNDSMQIKSVSKTSCDYVEEYKDVTKWIKWKDNSCKLIMFDFCY